MNVAIGTAMDEALEQAVESGQVPGVVALAADARRHLQRLAAPLIAASSPGHGIHAGGNMINADEERCIRGSLDSARAAATPI